MDAAAGRTDAFRRFADEHLDASYRLASAILGNPADAEDAVHDAFVTAWRKWGSLRDPALFGHWFHRIVVNTCRDRLRQATRSRIRDISDGVLLASDDVFAAMHDRELIDTALAGLGVDDRIVLVLRYYRDLTVDDIARLTGVRPGTVMSRLHRAQGRMRGVLMGADHPGAAR